MLKTTGDHLEHNFGHGKQSLSATMLSRNLLAFRCHTVLEWRDEKYALLRQVLARVTPHLTVVRCACNANGVQPYSSGYVPQRDAEDRAWTPHRHSAPIGPALPAAKPARATSLSIRGRRNDFSATSHKTFSTTKGTVFDRLRTAAETVVLVGDLARSWGSVQAIVAAFGFDERTVAAWWARAGQEARAGVPG